MHLLVLSPSVLENDIFSFLGIFFLLLFVPPNSFYGFATVYKSQGFIQYSLHALCSPHSPSAESFTGFFNIKSKPTFPVGLERSPPWAFFIKCQLTIHICLFSACVTDTNVMTRLIFCVSQLQMEHRCYSLTAKYNTDAVRVRLHAKRSNHMPQCTLYPSKRPSSCSAKQRRKQACSTGEGKHFSQNDGEIVIK